MVTLTRGDLDFILDQILISEAHAAGASLTDLLPNVELPWGVRTVDGSFNNLLPGQSEFGAADNPFPRSLDPRWFDEGDDAMAFGPPIMVPLIDPDTNQPVLDPDTNQPVLVPLSMPGVNGPGTEVPLGYIPGPGGNWLNNNDYEIQSANIFSDPRSIQPGDVVDADPRIITNLIADQTASNPAAVRSAIEYWAGLEGAELNDAVVAYVNAFAAGDTVGIEQMNAELGLVVTSEGTLVIPNQAPDEGLSAPFNSWFTLFGQFFDHGLDLVAKGGYGTVYIPLQPDDPLYVPDGNSNFMVVTRATLVATPGADGILGTEDDGQEPINLTTPWVDQNQTYTSHPSHQVFHREYEMRGGVPVATGRLLDGEGGGLANWAEVKAQARDLLGIELDDQDVLNVPLLATDAYGNFIPGANGFPQIVTEGGALVEGNPASPVGTSLAVGTGHAFLDDIAHTANPAGKVGDADGELGIVTLTNPAFDDQFSGPETFLLEGTQIVVANPLYDGGQSPSVTNPEYLRPSAVFDNELLERHFVTGDGRGNENIGLTTVHHVFHSEHNRMVDQIQHIIVEGGDPLFLSEWLAGGVLPDGFTFPDPQDAAAVQATIDSLAWNGERLFQAAKVPTEMQYQHLVFEEFARKVQPFVNIFNDYDAQLDASILAEFAHTVYRFGHSMLNETVDLMDPVTHEVTEVGLIEAFLNPVGFHHQVQANGLLPTDGLEAFDADLVAGMVVQGMTRQVGNAIDEHVTEALRNNLLGLPLDLAAINIARARENGVPSLNEARAQFYAGTNDSQLKPYDSWLDFALNIKNPASIVNFIAAYGTHDSVTGVNTVEDKRDAATKIVFGDFSLSGQARIDFDTDRQDFLNARGEYAGGSLGGLNAVDFWIGGLAEQTMIFGGMLGSTFNFVFETQLEALQNADRFYYLNRLANLNLTAQLENNKFSEMVHRNTDAVHLPGDVFSTPSWILEVDQSRQFTGIENTDEATSTDVDVAIVNASFEAQSLTSGQPGVTTSPLGNFTVGSPNGWSINIAGQGGLFSPAAGINDPAGRDGDNVVWLRNGATLSQNTGQALSEGEQYILNFDVGDRTDNAFPGGTARLIATNGTDNVELASTALPAPADGDWAAVTLSTGAIAASLAGYELRIEIQQNGAGGSNQILIDDISVSASITTFELNGDPTNGDPILQAINPLVQRGPGFLRFTGADHVVLGGTDGNDHLVGGLGDDTFWGDGGNDTIEGGQGNDLIFGGDGDDIITDLFGDDEIRSGAGNDAVNSGQGFDLIITDTGKDFVLGGEDDNETLAGQGDDFVNGGEGQDMVIGGEGNDWLEGGGENNLLLGDNGDLVQGLPIKRSVTSQIEGHDVLLSSGGNEDFDAEQGDDIMVGGLGTDRFFGQFGYDWATYFTDPYGIEVDMNNRLFAPPATPGSPGAILDRYAQTEAFSGSQFGDIIRGDDENDLAAGGVDGLDNALYTENVGLITGLGDLLTGIAATDLTTDTTGAVAYSTGNILLGGDGSDIIEGRGGNDIIDGDKWLNVRLEVRDSNGNAIGTTDRMQGAIELDFGNGNVVQTTLANAVFDGLVNPGDIHIVREILDTTTDADPGSAGYDGDFDTALFSDVRANYTITELSPGQWRVSHDSAVGLNDGLGVDGVDIVTGIERLQFADGNILLVQGLNQEPTGQPMILGQVAVGQALTAVRGTIADGDGVNPPVDFFWEADFGTGVFEPITINIADELVPLRGTTFVVTPDLEGLPLRVRAVFRDGNGVLEQVNSEPTAIVAPIAVTAATNGDDIITGTLGADFIDALAGNDIINALDGNDTIVGGPGNDIIDGGTDIGGLDVDVALFFGDVADFSFALNAEGNLEVITTENGVLVEDALINIEIVRIIDAQGIATDFSVADILDGEQITGTENADTIVGSEFGDTIFGLGGDDIIDGAGGNDTIDGGEGADDIDGGVGDNVIFGGNGADTIRGRTGNDAIDGGAGNDIISGGGGNDTIDGGDGASDELTLDGALGDFTFGSTTDGAVTLTNALGEVLTVSNVESFVFDDATLTGAEVNLLAGIIGGGDNPIAFTGTAAAETITGGSANDTISGGGGADTILGNDGADILNGDGGADTITGGAGSDTIDGGAGADTAIFAASFLTTTAGFTVDGALTLAAGADTDVVSNVETFIFADQTLTVAQLEAAANINRFGAGAQTFNGLPGNVSEFASGGGGNDTISGGGGNDILLGEGGADLLNGGNGADTLNGGAANDVLNGDNGADVLIGGAGNDLVNGGAGNDTVIWNVGDGRDTIDGGLEGAGANAADTLFINGDAAVAETFDIYTAAEAAAAGLNALGSEIVITRTINGAAPTNANRIVLMSEIEELVINANPVGAGAVQQSAGDTIRIHGNFDPPATSLALNTITVNGTSGDDIIDITGLDSDHRIVLRSNGGNDRFIGTLRPQDVIELAPSSSLAGYTRSANDDGSTTLTDGTNSVTFVSGATSPVITNDVGQLLLDDGEVVPTSDTTAPPPVDAPADTTPPEGSGEATTPPPTASNGASPALPLIGTAVAETMVGSAAGDTIAGLGGDDVMLAGAGDDTIAAGDGDDTVVGGDGNDLMFGDAGNDTIIGEAGDDVVFGGGGNDTILTGSGDDIVEAGKGRDIVFAGDGSDLILATEGDGGDVYDGGQGFDTVDYSALTDAVTVDFGLTGFGQVSGSQSGTDSLSNIEHVVGGAGNDVFVANASVNVMTGGIGNDTFVFGSVEAADGDRITDFRAGDRIDLSAIVDSSLGGQTMSLAEGPAITAAGQVVFRHEQKDDGIYTVVEGSLDGENRSFQIELNGRHTLTASDFIGVG